MKVIGLVLLVALAASAPAVQEPATSPDAPGLKVVSNQWRREVRNPELLEDPTNITQSRTPEQRAQKDLNLNSTRVPVNRLLIPEAPKEPKKPNQNPNDPRVQYVFEIKVLNSGNLTIRKLTWDFDLVEPDTGREVGHHAFTSTKTIRAGKTVKLVERSARNPISLVDAKKAGRDSARQYVVRVIINRVEYDQGPAWVRPSN